MSFGIRTGLIPSVVDRLAVSFSSIGNTNDALFATIEIQTPGRRQSCKARQGPLPRPVAYGIEGLGRCGGRTLDWNTSQGQGLFEL